MVRRKKEDAEATRRAIIAAARDVFYESGVANTSLEQIAERAGVTRGAIYWHFTDKAELFYAMRDEVRLPLVDRSNQELVSPRASGDPLAAVERFILTLLAGFEDDVAVQRTLWIMTFQCEYVGEFARDLHNACGMHAELKAKLTTLYRRARRVGVLRADLSPRCAALDTVVFVAGLIRIWILDDDGTLVKRDARGLIRAHVRAKRAAPVPSPAVPLSRARRT